MRCSSCGATLKTDKKDRSHAICEYCGSEYFFEWDDNKKEVVKEKPKKAKEQKTIPATKTQSADSKFIMGLVILFLVFVIVFLIFQLSGKKEDDYPVSAPASNSVYTPVSDQESLTVSTSIDYANYDFRVDGVLKYLVETVYEKPLEEISAPELEAFKWIATKKTGDDRQIGYSFEDPYDNDKAELFWLQIPKEVGYSGFSSLKAFRGVTVFQGASLYVNDYKGLKLKEFRGECNSFTELAESLEDPSILRKYSTSRENLNIEGIEAFTSLESLSIDCNNIEGIKDIAKVQTLKELSFEIYKQKYSFAFLSEMPNVEKLSFDVDELRNIDFIADIENLKELEFENCSITNLNPLASCKNLKSLKWSRCKELKDVSVVESLSSLEELSFILNYDSDPINLSNLKNLRWLEAGRLKDLESISNLTKLEYLLLDQCEMLHSVDFSHLKKLKTLCVKASSSSSQKMDFEFVKTIPSLEVLDMSEFETYSNIAPALNNQKLKKVYLNDFKGEINFLQLEDNNSIEEIEINHVRLYNNVYIQSDGFITNIWYDDVSLLDNLDFLKHYKNLKHLSINNNKLVDVSFAKELTTLEYLSVEGNDIVDISSLASHPSLKVVNCKDNPSDDYESIGSGIEIIK